MTTPERKYFNWVLDQIGFKQIPNYKRYRKLTWHLFHVPFTWILPEDEHRALDGLILRKEYGLNYGFLQDCSVLEMLAEFALRIETEWIGNPRNFRPEIIFWTMIQNLGLDMIFDDVYLASHVEYILSMWMNRTYNPDGSGGIFPMKYTDRNQRNVSLWDQMLEYITENKLC